MNFINVNFLASFSLSISLIQAVVYLQEELGEWDVGVEVSEQMA